MTHTTQWVLLRAPGLLQLSATLSPLVLCYQNIIAGKWGGKEGSAVIGGKADIPAPMNYFPACLTRYNSYSTLCNEAATG